MNYVYPILEIDHVTDGDTVRVKIPLMESRGSRLISVRLTGIDAPEAKNTRNGGMLEKRAGLRVGDVVMRWLKLRADRDAQFYVSSDKKPKYHGRIIGTIYDEWPLFASQADNSLNAYLLSSKLVLPYEGGSRHLWTPDELNEILERANAIMDS